jgi:hypothetical protein
LQRPENFKEGEIVEPELASKLVNGLKLAGINFVTYLPETRLSQILPLMREDRSFQLAPVASEAEGVSIAAGAALGGKQVASYMEDTGIFVSTYNLLTVAERFGVPMLFWFPTLEAWPTNEIVFSTFAAAPECCSFHSQIPFVGKAQRASSCCSSTD